MYIIHKCKYSTPGNFVVSTDTLTLRGQQLKRFAIAKEFFKWTSGFTDGWKPSQLILYIAIAWFWKIAYTHYYTQSLAFLNPSIWMSSLQPHLTAPPLALHLPLFAHSSFYIADWSHIHSLDLILPTPAFFLFIV